MESFEELEAWKAAREVVSSVYSLGKMDGLYGDFGLRNQLQRAAVSIMTNIAEGFERVHTPEKLQFYNVARGSAGELRSLLYVVEDNYPNISERAKTLRATVIRTGRLITGLIRSTRRRSKT